MNNRPLNPIIPSQFASNPQHHVIIKAYIQERYNTSKVLANHSSSFRFQSNTYIKAYYHHTNLRINQSKPITFYKTKSNHVITSYSSNKLKKFFKNRSWSLSDYQRWNKRAEADKSSLRAKPGDVWSLAVATGRWATT
ncbi:hypothetical protein QL285_080775 [Trifolium repens]|nr:hypothetical protein QL285_080775 [Trifolium repens]